MRAKPTYEKVLDFQQQDPLQQAEIVIEPMRYRPLALLELLELLVSPPRI